MGHILVTTPKNKSELAEIEAELVNDDPNSYWFRTIRGRPNVQVGDRVYYVDKGQIRGYGIIFEIIHGELECGLTGKIYKGSHLKQREWVWLESPISFKGFQGFRYLDRLPKIMKKLGL